MLSQNTPDVSMFRNTASLMLSAEQSQVQDTTVLNDPKYADMQQIINLGKTVRPNTSVKPNCKLDQVKEEILCL